MKQHAKRSAVGLTIYCDQFIDILKADAEHLSKFQVIVCSVSCSKTMERKKLKLANELWEADIRCGILYRKFDVSIFNLVFLKFRYCRRF